MIKAQTGPVAITGATGFIGGYLHRYLTSSGVVVRGISRDGGNGMVASGDLALVEPDWQAMLAGVDTVIHCAAITHPPLQEPTAGKVLRGRLYRVNCDVVRSLAKSCLKHGVRRLIFLSTVKVYGESSSQSQPFVETDKLNPENDYGTSKRDAEDILRPFVGKGLEVCCLRLPLVYGPKPKANFMRLHKLAVSGLPLPLASISNRRSTLGLNNLCTVIDGLMALNSWPFFELNVADPKPVSTPQLIKAIAAASDKKAFLLPFPVSAMRLVAKVLGRERDVERLVGDLEVSVRRLSQSLPGLALLNTGDSIRLVREQGEFMGGARDKG